MSGQALIQWATPTQRADGSALPAAQISQFNLKRATAAAGPFSTIVTLPPDKVNYLDTGLDPATYYYKLTTTDTLGSEGADSNVVQKTVLSPPNPPGSVTIT